MIDAKTVDQQQSKIDKIYDFVVRMQDFYYDNLDINDPDKNIIPMTRAVSYQIIRYFIEDLMDDECDLSKRYWNSKMINKGENK